MRLKKIKKYRAVLLLVALSSISCVSENYLNIRIEAPGKKVLDLNQFSEIYITDFLIKSKTKDFDLNKELIDYFTSELGNNFEGKISPRKVPLEKEDVFKDEAFWKNLSSDTENSLLLTGSIQYREEVRKAILEKSKKSSEDPFRPEKTLAERRFYLLSFDLYLIDGKTGKPLYEKSFKESRNYDNPNQTAYFAFFDLMKAVKEKLFRSILGERKIQQRYLISR